jgi:outer membrane protein assembly factor BamB
MGMSRHSLLAIALASALGLGTSVVLGSEILSEPFAAQHGLTRSWFTQVQIDRSLGRITDVVIDDGTLFALTDQAMLTAIDASTGSALWSQPVGKRGSPCVTPAANSRMVTVVNGTEVYVFNRFNGSLLWQTKLEFAPSAGPALSEQRVYVPLANGKLVSYWLKQLKDPTAELGKVAAKPATAEEQAARDQERRESIRLDQSAIPPLMYLSSAARTRIPPIITRQTPEQEYVAWVDDLGHLLVGRVNRLDHKKFELLYRLQTDKPISAQPTYLPSDSRLSNEYGTILAASEDGFVHAISEKDGKHLWRFPTGSPIVHPAVVLSHVVLVPNQEGGMYCLNAAKKGEQIWWTPNVTNFLAASKDRLYTTDKLGQIVTLDLRTGAPLDTIPATEMLPIKPINAETDRMYLATKTGLIECLHEKDLTEPIVHYSRPKPIEVAEATKAKKDDEFKPASSAPVAGGPAKSHDKKPKPTTKGKKGAAADMGGAGPPVKGKKKKGAAFGANN